MFALSADEEIRTIHTAMRFAGRFYASLATAGTHADPDNRRRLLAAFPELQKTYGLVRRFTTLPMTKVCRSKRRTRSSCCCSTSHAAFSLFY